MRRGIILLGVFIILLVAPTIVRYVNYNTFKNTDRGEIPTYNPVEEVIAEPTPASSNYVDEPAVGQGSILLDVAHNNAFTLDELGYLNGRLSARGFDLIPYEEGNLAAQLRAVSAFLVITPLSGFSFAEVQAVNEFVDRGGRLLLVGDPTRYNVVIEEDLFDINIIIEDDQIPLNSLASEFDITFKGDYLYNIVRNEGNFKNILLDETSFGESALTADLEQIAFYGAHSLEVGPEGEVLLAGDDNTWSSATDRPGGLTLGATSHNGRVLALSDIQFMTEPYHTSFDNDRFIAHIADFLTEMESREFLLSDFPYFYSPAINLVYSGRPDLGPQAFAQVIQLQDAFQTVGKELSLAAEGESDGDTLYLGLYNQADDVLEILASKGISLTIEPPILTEEEEIALAEEEKGETGEGDVEEEAGEPAPEEPAEGEAPKEGEPQDGDASEGEEKEMERTIRLVHTPLGNVQMSGTAVVLLDDEGGNGRRQVVVLAASREGLDNTIGLLRDIIPLDADYAQAGCLVQDNLALCPTHITDEEVEAELLTGGEPEEEGEAETEEGGAEEEGGSAEDLNAVSQGTISLGETVEGELGENESHAWTFSDGPAVIDITLEGGEELDAILELYDPDNEFVTSSDSTFTEGTEEIIGAEIESDGDYTIVIRDFYDDGGTYTLTVVESEVEPGEEGEGESNIENIFILVDDDGEPLSGGITSAETFISYFGDDYEITTWVSSIDGPVDENTLEGTDLLIWDSGDYRNEEGLFDDEVYIILEFLDSGIPFFITGSSPSLLSDAELAPLSDLEVSSEDHVMLSGLTGGDIIELEDSYEVVLSDTLSNETEEGTASLLLRGPESEAAGDIVSVASEDTTTGQKSILLLLPYIALPEDVQITLLDNMMTWFTTE